jgi:FixJ family two-component response regulator
MGKGFDLPVIFMTGHGSIPMSVKAMKSGAIDFLSKPFEKKDLLAAIGQALTHDIRRLEEAHEKKEINALLDTLTPREKEVMRFVIAGRLNKQSARALGIAEKTIKVHRSRVMQKTGVSSVAELVRLAEKAGIAPAD